MDEGGGNGGAPRGGERAAYMLRGLYERHGYQKYRMRKFEEYDFYTENRDFLPSGQILTFTDLDGKLMALKPDVTMSIVKRTRATPERPERLYYSESIYRPARDSREFREIPQIGVEYIGKVGAETGREIVGLALESLACFGGRYILDISHNGFVAGLFDSVGAPAAVKRDIARLLEKKSAHELEALLSENNIKGDSAGRLMSLLSLEPDAGAQGGHAGGTGTPDRAARTSPLGLALEKARRLVANEAMGAALDELDGLCAAMSGDPAALGALRLDFSLAHDKTYYNGLVMRGHIENAPRAVLSGGRYDRLLRRMGIERLEAIGFAVYIDEADALSSMKPTEANAFSCIKPTEADAFSCIKPTEASAFSCIKPTEAGEDADPADARPQNAKTINIAIPKGRMGDKACQIFAAAGYPCAGLNEESRKLVFADESARVSYLLIKPQDVAAYVELGAADVGVVGKDTLLETAPDVYELLDMKIGKCRLAVAAPENYEEDHGRVLRVATKYPNVTRAFFSRQNRDIDVIKLNGSIELAPLLGVSDVIVDVVDTGATLRENHMKVGEEIAQSSARLIANINSYKFKHNEIAQLLADVNSCIG